MRSDSPLAQLYREPLPMPAPATIDELLDLGYKGGLIEKDSLSDYLRKLKEEGTEPSGPRTWPRPWCATAS